MMVLCLFPGFAPQAAKPQTNAEADQ